MYKRWIVKEIPDEEIVEKLCSEINVSKPLGAILAQRGIDSFEKAKAFFRPKLEDLHDPFLMKDMQIAVERLQKAIENEERILIYGDYDVDGTSAVSLMYSFLKKFYNHIDYYVPDRYQEGYGVSKRGIDYAASEGCSLIIALDCGIRAIDKVEYANSLGLDFIICDHHKPGETVPEATAILNPKQVDCSYPYKELTGCAIGFKLIQAYTIYQELNLEEAFNYMDYAAVSIACDIVPVTGENRIIAKFGLDQINNTPRPAYHALKQLAGLPQNLTVSNVVFGFGPRINAAGRISHANQAVKLLITQTLEEALESAKDVHQKNDTRKIYDEQITNEALAMMDCGGTSYGKTTVLFKDDWHKGIIGIVASRCIEKCYRPTIIITSSNGKATGSARSVKDFDIHEAIAACSKHLIQFGGHKYAAGITLEIDQVPAFAHQFEKVVSETILPDQLIPKIEIDAQLDLSQITWNFYKIIEQMSPFGPENLRPVFVSEVVCDKGKIRLLKEKHLKLTVRQKETSFCLDAIAFNFGEFYRELMSRDGAPFYICYTIEKNEYKGKVTLQLMIKDIKTRLEHPLEASPSN
ncbi:single-stranded-DNA-specific exonuclease RecJ [Chondrinema litorale]|uniref:single-stranded-DNA-specific exonuclease RecJ n=1 Tax=Chondrinema litorale TaxID=2994555 RepID=UPI002543877B|nr:single-stranded-DNA-specific exonuclease RecJ [Chondrinema litorale]UZR92592.1 single-stranded-DNA-specific exonuclease RecJ [Chondrinema litorale]